MKIPLLLFFRSIVRSFFRILPKSCPIFEGEEDRFDVDEIFDDYRFSELEQDRV